jgi:electron transfer flavoprotein alpha subunit
MFVGKAGQDLLPERLETAITKYQKVKKKLEIPEYGIVVTLLIKDEKSAGSITSQLYEKAFRDKIDNHAIEHTLVEETRVDASIKAAVDTLEAMILAQACAGMDITSLVYRESLQTTIEAMVNNLF